MISFNHLFFFETKALHAKSVLLILNPSGMQMLVKYSLAMQSAQIFSSAFFFSVSSVMDLPTI